MLTNSSKLLELEFLLLSSKNIPAWDRVRDFTVDILRGRFIKRDNLFFSNYCLVGLHFHPDLCRASFTSLNGLS